MPASQKELQEIFSLTPVQQFMLDCSEHTPSGLAFQQQYSYYLEGKVDPELCRKAWEVVVARHPAMRASIHHKGTSQAFQVIHAATFLPFELHDVSQLHEDERNGRVLAFLSEDARTPFDISRPPLMRLCLHKMRDDLFILTLTLSHLIFDGWSLGVAFRHFAQAYGELSQGLAPDATPLPSMRDYISWFKKRDQSEDLAWWREKLATAQMQPLPFMRLPEESRPVEADQIYHMVLSEEETASLDAAARKLGITLNVLYQGAWALILSRLSPQRRALMLTVAASRPVEVPGIEQVFGLLIDGVPYNVECAGGQTASTWLEELRGLQLESLEHRHVPVDTWLRPCRDSDMIPYNSYLIFENMATGEGGDEKADFSIRAAYMNSNLSFPLSMMVFPGPALRVAFIYCKDFFTHETIVKFSELIRRTLLTLAENSDKTLDRISELAGLNEETIR
ncbi:MAG: hypothetical protein BCS36_06620 [Desulfovibrio sp. MES5]|uniref:condensation domain-containing protein n=1 Tax=Desulfovibrio sp. MES5 TaxID=1899016 RepID=UPI000B9D36A9|nr:condensation domain-containing protein [Desulfovibrio sp. MES5]OXS30141.1 MAG: hypothetical protein BCS36_06620 [Desulfovibrio sp. MES5]